MANVLKGKKIVLGITGSIAAYKACYIIRGLILESFAQQGFLPRFPGRAEGAGQIAS